MLLNILSCKILSTDPVSDQNNVLVDVFIHIQAIPDRNLQIVLHVGQYRFFNEVLQTLHSFIQNLCAMTGKNEGDFKKNGGKFPRESTQIHMCMNDIVFPLLVLRSYPEENRKNRENSFRKVEKSSGTPAPEYSHFPVQQHLVPIIHGSIL